MSQDFMTSLIIILVTFIKWILETFSSSSPLVLFDFRACPINHSLSTFSITIHSRHLKMKGIHYDGKFYVLVDTKGDGNCLYHSIVASRKVNITDAGILRKHIYEKVSEWMNTASQEMVVVFKIYGALQDFGLSLQEFINRQRQSAISIVDPHCPLCLWRLINSCKLRPKSWSAPYILKTTTISWEAVFLLKSDN